MSDFERQLLADVEKSKCKMQVLKTLIWALACVLMFTIGTVAYYTYDYICSLVIEYEETEEVVTVDSEGSGNALYIEGNNNQTTATTGAQNGESDNQKN